MQPETNGLSVVLLGNFNPKIFQPQWFAAQGLLRGLEAEDADIEIVHNDITIFCLDWLRLEVTRERFLAATEQEAYFEILIDFINGAFSLLKHTPIGMMGINSDAHYRLRSEEKWHGIGDKLAPKDVWKGILEKPGMRRLDMYEPRENGPKGHARIRVEPSKKCHPGIYVNYNDHFEVEDPPNVIGCEEIISMLLFHWQQSVGKADSIALNLIDRS